MCPKRQVNWAEIELYGESKNENTEFLRRIFKVIGERKENEGKGPTLLTVIQPIIEKNPRIEVNKKYVTPGQFNSDSEIKRLF